MALGLSTNEAVRAAKDYVLRIIKASVDLGLGKGFGPMNHMAGIF
jgi:hydroxymethylpyrimidine/phosphomethylpyrimidine kinase